MVNHAEKSHSKINQTEREAIFHEFWGTGNYEKQKEFISKTAIDASVKRVRVSNRSKKRNKSFQYSVTVRGEQISVCKQFYVDTLDVSVKVTEWPPFGKIAAHSAYEMFSWYKYLIVSLVFSHLGFWSGNIFLIAPFPDLCLLVPFFPCNH